MVDYGFFELGLHRIELTVNADNTHAWFHRRARARRRPPPVRVGAFVTKRRG